MIDGYDITDPTRAYQEETTSGDVSQWHPVTTDRK